MRFAVTADVARSAEDDAVRAGLTLADLMERAGVAVAAEVSSVAGVGRVVVVTGAGNNGGDGWVAARCLHDAGREVAVLALAPPESLGALAASAARGALEVGVPWSEVTSAEQSALMLSDAVCIVDAVLGIGLHGAPRDRVEALLGAIDGADALVVAVDIPSGVVADTGEVPGVAVHADLTVALGWPKVGSVIQPGASYSGELVVVDIGLPAVVAGRGVLEVWDWAELSGLLPVPGMMDTKQTRGRLLLVGGSPGMTGAVVLAGQAALRMGAGHVTVAVPAPSLPVIECTLIAPVKVSLDVDTDGGLGAPALARLLELAARADAVVLGPGLGRMASTAQTVRDFVRDAEVPMVVDADALWAFGRDLAPLHGRSAPVVLTPHSGEAARLMGVSIESVEADRPAAVRALAGGSAVGLLKGPRTLASDRGRTVVTMTGGPALATLGTGDVLAGMVGALLAQGLDAMDAAVLAAHLHGSAGDEAARRLTPICCTAPDVITYLPEAVRALLG